MSIPFINVQYCYDYLIGQIPVGLLLYSHIPTAIIALLFGGYIVFAVKKNKIPSYALFVACVSFAIWSLFDLISWFSFFGSNVTMFAWSLLDLVTLIMFFAGYYFLYSFVSKRDLPIWQKISSFVLLLPTAVWTFLGLNLISYDANSCIANENNLMTNYLFIVEGLFIFASLIFLITKYLKTREKESKKELVLASSGVIIFLGLFFSSTFLVSILSESDVSSYVYNYEIYGLFGMPILLMFLGYLIVKYQSFNVKLIGAQALVLALVTVIGSELFFTQNLTNTVLVLITLLLSLIFGYFLIKNVKIEVEAREKIQKLAQQLQMANTNISEANTKLKELDKQKSEFVSFASHQLRSPMTAMKGYASMMFEGDYGAIPDNLMPPIKIIYQSTETLISLVEDYLNISRIELGTMRYNLEPMDLKDLAEEAVNEQRPNVEKRSLTLDFKFDSAQKYMVNIDKDKFKQVLMNLVDNAVKYTPTGSIVVELSKISATGMIRYAVKDTGIGLSATIIPKLFQKWSRADNARMENIKGTGLGLFVARQMTEAHHGRVWAESPGEGLGSTFAVELPEVK